MISQYSWIHDHARHLCLRAYNTRLLFGIKEEGKLTRQLPIQFFLDTGYWIFVCLRVHISLSTPVGELHFLRQINLCCDNWCLQGRRREMGSGWSADKSLCKFLKRLIFNWHSTLCTGQYPSPRNSHSTPYSWLQCSGNSPHLYFSYIADIAGNLWLNYSHVIYLEPCFGLGNSDVSVVIWSVLTTYKHDVFPPVKLDFRSMELL